MLGFLFRKIFGSVNDRFIKSLGKDINLINSFEEKFAKLTDEELAGYTNIFKEKLAEGLSLEDILHESFAVVREVSKRVLGMRHFDVQLIGGIVQHRGMVSEMRTGEGKTLVCTLPAYLNALTGKGVHVVTTNDYLVKRDAAWMGKIYEFLGLTVGCVVPGLTEAERVEAYNSDITYATNNELGFDFLRDNMKMSENMLVQRAFNYAILDEADSILIDEARTPLIISGPTEDNSELYYKIDKIIPHLEAANYEIDEKSRSVNLTDMGISMVEELLIKEGLVNPEGNLYDIENVIILHHVNQALKAHKLFAKDVDYMIKDNKVVIIDEFTGRMMEGRRYSDGLHQALEAKENVEIQNENQTLASITFQNYFRMYPKLAGMTGTAMTEANEFREVYKLEVVEVPTNIPVTRIDEDDEIYRTADEKVEAIIKRIKEAHDNLQPVLVGTVSIEKSELLSSMLKKHKIKHQVLNAKYHEQEAEIIAQAGRLGAVTIATNMAGRGTDIKLGGNAEMLFKEQAVGIEDSEKLSELEAKIIAEVEADKQKVLASGGLLVIGTERHESRRIDNQLRGRCGRQGDPGKTIFFLSLEDDLMRIFASEKMGGLLQRLGLKHGEAITHPLISKALEKAQQRVEAHNYEIRKNLLKFDDVMNDQRQVIYKERKEIMQADNIGEVVSQLRESLNHDLIDLYMPKSAYREEWDLKGLEKSIYHHYMINIDLTSQEFSEDEILAKINEGTANLFKQKEELYGLENMRMLEKRLFIVTMDGLWKDHLHALDHLRQGINLRAYGQKDPLSEYKREAFNLFSSMLDNLHQTFITNLALARIVMPNEETSLEHKLDKLNTKVKMTESRHDVNEEIPLQIDGKIGRNEVCPCGSGKKYKHCHGVNA